MKINSRLRPFILTSLVFLGLFIMLFADGLTTAYPSMWLLWIIGALVFIKGLHPTEVCEKFQLVRSKITRK